MIQYLSVREVAEILQVSNRTVINLIERGRFPGAHKIDQLAKNSPYRIPRQAVKPFLELNAMPAPSAT